MAEILPHDGHIHVVLADGLLPQLDALPDTQRSRLVQSIQAVQGPPVVVDSHRHAFRIVAKRPRGKTPHVQRRLFGLAIVLRGELLFKAMRELFEVLSGVRQDDAW